MKVVIYLFIILVTVAVIGCADPCRTTKEDHAYWVEKSKDEDNSTHR